MEQSLSAVDADDSMLKAERLMFQVCASDRFVDEGTVVEWREVPGVQPPITFDEFLASNEAIRADPDWQAAMRKRGVTGETLLQLLETRIDNVVYRLGLANTRSAARQLVSHGHVMVNGRTVNVASYNVKAGNEIAIKDRPKSRQLALRNLELTQIVPVPDWLTVDRDALKGKVAHIPSREEMQPMVNEQLIVELYSR